MGYFEEVHMKTVYKTKYFTVKKNEEFPTPRYMIYNNESGEMVHTTKSQVEATMWVKRN